MDTSVVIECEEESGPGWLFDVLVEADGWKGHHRVRLSWVDHEYWSRGGRAPSHVARELVAFLIERGGVESLRPEFDAALARRLHPDTDEELPKRL